MTRVVAIFSDRRVMVAISKMVGNEENSSGFWIHNATIRISTEKAIEKASPISMRKGGIGRNSTHRMTRMPRGKPTSRMLGVTLGSAIAGGCAIDRFRLFMRGGKRQGRLPNSNRQLNGEACAKVVQHQPWHHSPAGETMQNRSVA